MNKFFKLLLFLMMVTTSSCLGLIDEQSEELSANSQEIQDDGGQTEETGFAIPQPILDLREMSFQTIPHNLYEYAATLPDPVVNSMAIDSKGVLYIATSAGLAISPDNGQNFYVKTTLHGLPTNMINSVFIDNNDVIYLATHGGGLATSNDGGETFQFKLYTPGLFNGYLRKVYVDYLGKIYVIPYNYITNQNDGFCRSDDMGNTYQCWGLLDGLASRNVLDIRVNPTTNYLYVAREAGIDISVNQGLTFIGIGVNNINQIFNDSSGNIYATTSGDGLWKFSEQGALIKKFSMADNSLASNLTTSFTMNSNGDMYVTTSNGLSISTDDGENFETLNEDNADLPTNQLSNVLLNGNSILIGSYKGLSIKGSGNNKFSTLGVNHGLVTNNFKKVKVDKDGNVFALSENRGIFISRDDGRTFFESTQGLPSPIINDIFIDNTGVLFASTDEGLAISNNFGEQYMTKHSANGLPSNKVNTVYVNAAGKVFVGTDNGLAISNDRFGLSFTAPSILTGVNILSIYDWDGYLLLGTEFYGLLISPDQGETFYQKTLDLNPTLIRDIDVNIFGHVYLATNDGLYISEDGSITFKRYNQNDRPSILSNDVLEIETDSRGIAYCVTAKGVNTILPIPAPFPYEIERKLPNFGVSALKVNAISIDRNGRAWLATEGGLSRTVGLDSE